MATIYKKVRDKVRRSENPRSFPVVVRTDYTSVPVDIPDSFLAPLTDPSKIQVNTIDFAKTPLSEYTGLYAVVLDNVLTQEECDEMICLAERSTGAHDDKSVENNGWKPAMVNASRNHEFLALDYRNSDRIVWDNRDLVHRLWLRIMQAEGMKEYFSVMEGKKYSPVMGEHAALRRGERWVISKQGPNERMRFLKYGAGQFFREHCDGTYVTPDGFQTSFYTMHLYLNDSAQALGIPEPSENAANEHEDGPKALLRGGATTFHSTPGHHGREERLDVDPKAGRVLIFQHRRLLHSGDDVTAGIKYTMRSDLMYEFEGGSDGDDGGVAFGLV